MGESFDLHYTLRVYMETLFHGAPFAADTVHLSSERSALVLRW